MGLELAAGNLATSASVKVSLMNIIRKMVRAWDILLESVWRPVDPIGYARHLGVRIGRNCRIGKKAGFGSEPYLVTLGDHVSISNGSEFITHDGGIWVFRKEFPRKAIFGPITVGNNVFIGAHVIVLPGVTIGNNCVIGAGSIVTKSIPDNSVAAGIPARVLTSVDEYKAKIVPEGLDTHGLPPRKLRKFLEDHFVRKSS